MTPTPNCKSHSMSFPGSDSQGLVWSEKALNIVSCIPTPQAQFGTAIIHSALGAMQLFAGCQLLWTGTKNITKIRAHQVAHLERTLTEDDKAKKKESKEMVSSGIGHCFDGIENTVRGSVGWALGKYGLNAMKHFPGPLKFIPGAIGGLTLLAVNLYFPSTPFGQINRSWRDE